MYLEFWNFFVKEYGRLRMALVIIFFSITIALLEGINIGLLVPLLETLRSPGEEGGHWMSQAIADLYDFFGAPLEVWSILVGLTIIMSVIVSLKYLRTIIVGKEVVGFEVWMRSRYMWNLLNADMSLFHGERIGVQTGVMTTQVNQAGGSLLQMTELVANVGLVSAFFLAALLLSPILTGAAIGIVALVTIGVQYHVAKARKIGVVFVDRQNDYQASVVDTLSGVLVIKGFVLEKLRWIDTTKKAEAQGETAFHLMKNQGQMVSIQELALFGVVAGIVYVGVSVLNLDLAVVVALLFVLYRLMPRVSNINTQRQALGPTMAALNAVRVAIAETENSLIVSGDTPFTKLQKTVEFRDVSFSYNEATKVIKSINFQLEHGKMTAMVGASGAGKSTLVNLLLRYNDPVKGQVLVDGVDLKELNLNDWRKSIGLVSQDVFLFNDTVGNNISLGRDEITEDRLQKAAQRAFAHDFIQQLPNGYNTMVGDRGWNLSGGQRQRIALARAILLDSDILILDEATSALDSESENLIQAYIQEIKGTRTILVVAHRMSTIQNADNIFVIQDGAIVEQGDWDSLLAGAGVFATYHKLQSLD